MDEDTKTHIIFGSFKEIESAYDAARKSLSESVARDMETALDGYGTIASWNLGAFHEYVGFLTFTVEMIGFDQSKPFSQLMVEAAEKEARMKEIVSETALRHGMELYEVKERQFQDTGLLVTFSLANKNKRETELDVVEASYKQWRDEHELKDAILFKQEPILLCENDDGYELVEDESEPDSPNWSDCYFADDENDDNDCRFAEDDEEYAGKYESDSFPEDTEEQTASEVSGNTPIGKRFLLVPFLTLLVPFLTRWLFGALFLLIILTIAIPTIQDICRIPQDSQRVEKELEREVGKQ